MRRRVALAALAFGLGAPCAYFAERIYERRNGSVETPLTVLRSLHTGYYYRVGISLLVGVLVAWICAMALELRPVAPELRDGRVTLASALFAAAIFAWLATRFA